MSTKEIRQKLLEYIETAKDKKIKAIYTMVEEEIVNYKKSESKLSLIEPAKKSNRLNKTKESVKSIKPSTPYKKKVLKDLKQAVEEMKLVKQGKLKPIKADEFFNLL